MTVKSWPQWADKLRAFDSVRSAIRHLRKTRQNAKSKELRAAIEARAILIRINFQLINEAEDEFHEWKQLESMGKDK